MSKVTECVLDLPIQEGAGTTIYDKSRKGANGTLVNTPTWTQLPSGIWTLAFTGGSSQKVTIGDLGTLRTFELWVKLQDTTEIIFEQVSNQGVSATAGTLTYTQWDNAFVNGVDTDTITATWSHLVVTSTTDVTASAVSLALFNATYLTGSLAFIKAYKRELDLGDIRNAFIKSRSLFGV